MSQAARIKRNSIFAFLSNTTRLLSNVLIFVGIARLYGAEALGQFTTALTFATLFLIFADFGFDTLLATEVARSSENYDILASRFLSLKIITASCSSLAMVLVPFLHVMSVQTRILVFIFTLYVFMTSIQNYFFSFFKGLERFEHETKISFISNFLSIILLLLFGLLQLPLFAFAIILVVTRALGLAMSFRTASLILKNQWFHFSFDGWKEAKKEVLVFGAYTLFGVLYFQMDTILLAFWKGDQAVGIYQAVFRIILLILIISDIGINTLMPTLSRLHSTGSTQWNQIGHLFYKTLFLISLPITLILFIYAEQIIQILYGRGKFMEAIPILRLFSIIGFIRFIAEPFGLMLTTGHRQIVRMGIIIGAAFANFFLNMYFIPKYGPIGAAGISLITNILVAIAYLIATKPFLGFWIIDSSTLIPLAITLIISAFLWQIRDISIWYTGLPSVILCLIIGYSIGYKSIERKKIFDFKVKISL